MKYTNPTVLSGAATGSITGAAIPASQLIQGSFQVVTGDAAVAGTVLIQMSNDQNPSGDYDSTFVPMNWSAIPSATTTITAGVGAPILLTSMAYRYIRAVFTRTGGTTTIAVNALLMSI